MSIFQLLPLKETKDVEKITQLNSTSVYNLAHSGRLDTKKVNGKLYFCNQSLNEFVKFFNRDDYFEIDKVSSELKKNGVWDSFNIISKTDDKTKIKKRGCNIVYSYNRYLDEFPISPKQLLEKGLIVADRDMSPTLYSKLSVANAIKILKTKYLDEVKVKKADVIQKEIDFKKEKLLKQKNDKWEKEFLKCKIKKVPFDTPKPTLSIDEVSDIENTVNQKHTPIVSSNGEFKPINKKKTNRKPKSLKDIRKIGSKKAA